MYVQIMWWDGPRSAELVEAARRAGQERIAPLVESHPELRERLVGGFRSVGPDGSECVVELAHDPEALDALARVVMTSELLPGERADLLPGPDRVQRLEVQDVFGSLAAMLGVPR